MCLFAKKTIAFQQFSFPHFNIFIYADYIWRILVHLKLIAAPAGFNLAVNVSHNFKLPNLYVKCLLTLWLMCTYKVHAHGVHFKWDHWTYMEGRGLIARLLLITRSGVFCVFPMYRRTHTQMHSGLSFSTRYIPTIEYLFILDHTCARTPIH